MNKTKKGFLKASSILSIIEAGFMFLIGVALFFMVPLSGNKGAVISYFEDSDFKYVETAEGSYYFECYDDGVLIYTITEEDVEVIEKFAVGIFVTLGIITIGVGVAKLVMSILILNKGAKNAYSLGCAIALLVLSVVTGSMLQVAFLIAAMCISDKQNKQIDSSDLN